MCLVEYIIIFFYVFRTFSIVYEICEFSLHLLHHVHWNWINISITPFHSDNVYLFGMF